jgi:hypothetical protein
MMPTGDPRLDKPLVRIIQLCELIALQNDPNTTTGAASKSSNKPESRSPGSQQAPYSVIQAEREMTRLCKRLESLYEGAKVREQHGGTSDYTAAERDAGRRVRKERSHLIAVRKGASVNIDIQQPS